MARRRSMRAVTRGGRRGCRRQTEVRGLGAARAAEAQRAGHELRNPAGARQDGGQGYRGYRSPRVRRGAPAKKREGRHANRRRHPRP